MARLRDRNRSIPFGFKFKQPETGWEPAPWSSFETIVDGILAMRRGNPYLAKKHAWKMDRASIAEEVDAYNAKLCETHGWDAFIEGGQNDPKFQGHRSLGEKANAVVAGVKIIASMFGPEGPIRDKALATQRASVCVRCPKNERGDWTRYFTVPAQAMIRRGLAIVKDLDLTTEHDANLDICTACSCPLKGKVFARLDHILKNIPPEDKAALDPGCWILSEEKVLGK